MMPSDPDSPESRQIAEVAINEEETILKRPPAEGEDAGGGVPRRGPEAPHGSTSG